MQPETPVHKGEHAQGEGRAQGHTAPPSAPTARFVRLCFPPLGWKEADQRQRGGAEQICVNLWGSGLASSSRLSPSSSASAPGITHPPGAGRGVSTRGVGGDGEGTPAGQGQSSGSALPTPRGPAAGLARLYNK